MSRRAEYALSASFLLALFVLMFLAKHNWYLL